MEKVILLFVKRKNEQMLPNWRGGGVGGAGAEMPFAFTNVSVQLRAVHHAGTTMRNAPCALQGEAAPPAERLAGDSACHRGNQPLAADGLAGAMKREEWTICGRQSGRVEERKK